MSHKSVESVRLENVKSDTRDTVLVEADAAVEKDLTLWQALKEYYRISFYCIGLTSAILLYGYDYVIVGTTSSMPSFQCV